MIKYMSQGIGFESGLPTLFLRKQTLRGSPQNSWSKNLWKILVKYLRKISLILLVNF